MNCLEFRRRIAAEPRSCDPELEAHARECAACAGYLRQMRALDARIERALQIPVPLDTNALRARRAPATRFALAASFLLAAALATVLWITLPQASLASDVVRHMGHEPASLDGREVLSPAQVEEAIRRSGVRIDPAIGEVTYAQTCWFRGAWVPHLVVLEGNEPVTVLVLAGERDVRRQTFTEEGFTGMIVPARNGALAVLSRDEAQADAVARRVLRALR